MLKEIGSDFWISPEDLKVLGVSSKISLSAQEGCQDQVWLSTGRSAIKLALSQTKVAKRGRKVALVPAYTCETVLQPFIEMQYELRFYDIDACLRTSSETLIGLLGRVRADVFLFHHYFGFNTISGIEAVIDFAREHNIVTIEDCTQSMYSSFVKSSADYHVGSIRKWCGVADGAYLISKDSAIEWKPRQYDKSLEQAQLQASLAKYRYIVEEVGEKEDFLNQYRRSKEILELQREPYAISPLSIHIQRTLDLDELKGKRHANYVLLLNGKCWSEHIYPILQNLTEEVVPLYFPIWVADRSSLQKYLASHAVYAPVIWPKPECCTTFSQDTEELYQHMLCIPIDQRYSGEEMKYVIKTISSYDERS